MTGVPELCQLKTVALGFIQEINTMPNQESSLATVDSILSSATMKQLCSTTECLAEFFEYCFVVILGL